MNFEAFAKNLPFLIQWWDRCSYFQRDDFLSRYLRVDSGPASTDKMSVSSLVNESGETFIVTFDKQMNTTNSKNHR